MKISYLKERYFLWKIWYNWSK